MIFRGSRRRCYSVGPDIFDTLHTAHPRYYSYHSGPGVYDSDVMVTRTGSRKYVPSRTYEDTYMPATERANRIADSVHDDQDSLRAASRRSDAKLMDDINHRLDSGVYQARPNYMFRSHHYPELHHDHDYVHYPSSGYYGAHHYYPHLHHSEPVTPLYTRASSVPRSYGHYGHHGSHHGSHYYDDLRFPEYRPTTPLHHHSYSSTHRSSSLPPHSTASSDSAIRAARGAVSRLEHDLASGYSDVDDYVPRYHHHSYGHHHVPRHHHYVSTSPVVRRRTLAGRPPLPVSHRTRQIEEVTYGGSSLPAVAPMSMTHLRSKAASARSKMDHTKSLLDRYLPIHMGPEPDVEYEVQAKYGELADRMPELQAVHRHSSGVTAGSIPPYRAAPHQQHTRSHAADNIRVTAHAPPVSEARRHAREVLCKTKGDPNYYRL